MSDLFPAQWSTAALTQDFLKKLRLDRMFAVTEATLRDQTGQRADILAMHRTLNNRPFLIIEIKTSRGDLLGDLRREKWRGYLSDGAVAFAFPAGLADPKEIPPEAGVVVRSRNGWRWARSPRWHMAPPPTPYLYRRMILTLADQVAERTADLYRPKARGLFDAARKQGQETGRRLAEIASDIETWTQIVDEKKAYFDDLSDRHAALRGEVALLQSERRALQREIAA
jgi:hypothetical protein